MQLQYREVIYRFDLAADLKLTIGQARRNKRLHPRTGHPDMFIAAPRNGFHGLFIELKREGRTVWLQTGELAADMREQGEVLDSLQLLGYCANFAVGFDQAKKLIDDYLKGAIVKGETREQTLDRVHTLAA